MLTCSSECTHSTSSPMACLNSTAVRPHPHTLGSQSFSKSVSNSTLPFCSPALLQVGLGEPAECHRIMLQSKSSAASKKSRAQGILPGNETNVQHPWFQKARYQLWISEHLPHPRRQHGVVADGTDSAASPLGRTCPDLTGNPRHNT